ncbi:MAG: hypothetical protein ABI376_01825 [Caulobacteraceae bacterium]
MIKLPLIAVLVFVGAAPAWAGEAIATAVAAPAGGAPPTAAAPPLRIDSQPAFDDRGPIVGPCGGVAKAGRDGEIKPDRNPHGVVYGGVGTHGYNEVGGVVCQPIGDRSSLTIAVDRTQYPGARGR